MTRKRASKHPALAFRYEEDACNVTAVLLLDNRCQLDFVHESAPPVRVNGYPRQLKVSAALDEYLRRQGHEDSVDIRHSLDELAVVCEHQITLAVSQLRRDLRKLALLAVRAREVKHLRDRLSQ